MVQFAVYPSSFGPIIIGCEYNRIVSIRCGRSTVVHCPCAVTDLANTQLQEYFEGKRKTFDLPIELRGTPFQISVWNALLAIHYGEVRSYAQIAAAIGNPAACRAVGQAANRNPLWIVVPCHRVIGKNSGLTGYAGGLDMKQQLLELEKLHKKPRS